MENNFLQEKVLSYPILKHFDKNDIVLNPSEGGTLKPVAKTIMGTTVAAGAIGGGYLVWTYILPPVMLMLGQFIAIAATGVAAVTFLFLLPTILKGIKMFAKAAEKALIREAPFEELESQKVKMINQKNVVKNSRVKIKSLRSTMLNESLKSEQECKDYKEKILSSQTYCKNLRAKINEAVQEHGPQIRETSDDVAEMEIQLTKRLSEAQRFEYQYNQSEVYTQKYGAKAAVMAKLDINLAKAEAAMDIKVSDLETTIYMLNKDWEFAKTAKTATDAAVEVLGLTKDWQFQYALDVVTSTISMDLAKTSANLNDIEKLTSEYSIDNDELFNRLDVIANKFSTGQVDVIDSKKYANPNYKLTSEDKKLNPGFQDIF